MRLAGRSPQELLFRLKQAIANLRLLAFAPSGDLRGWLAEETSVEKSLDTALGNACATWSASSKEILELAKQMLEHRIPLLGAVVETGPDIQWRRDYLNGKSSGTTYFKFVPYLDFDKVGDHKNIWELNRHQHLVVLAQAHTLSGEAVYAEEIRRQLESWREQNPFLRGINWASALEVAFRALSWLWIEHLTGISLERGLWEHGAYLEANLSTYFSPNTHLLGEGVALHAIGVRLNEEKWRELGARIVAEEAVRQVQADGSHFEQSTYYHLYALDFFLLHYLLAGRPESCEPVLRKMARFLAAVMGPERLLTCFGDDDGGRLFHPYGRRGEFGRRTLETCGRWFPDEALRSATVLFPDSGLSSIVVGDTHVLMDAGGFGWGGAGHSHADTLSVTARVGTREILIDPGTFTYVGDAKLRDEFRGTGFHNTIRIDGLDQAVPVGPFRWEGKPAVEVIEWRAEEGMAFLDASCHYRGVTHRRRLLVVGGEWLIAVDRVSGPEGEHSIEQNWHLGSGDVVVLFSHPGAVKSETGFRSHVFGCREAAPVLRASWVTTLPHVCAAVVGLRGAGAGLGLELRGLDCRIPGVLRVSFTEPGMPKVTWE